jgi:hypothetical protein
MADIQGESRENEAISGFSYSVQLFFHKWIIRYFGPCGRPYPYAGKNLEADEFLPRK